MTRKKYFCKFVFLCVLLKVEKFATKDRHLNIPSFQSSWQIKNASQKIKMFSNAWIWSPDISPFFGKVMVNFTNNFPLLNGFPRIGIPSLWMDFKSPGRIISPGSHPTINFRPSKCSIWNLNPHSASEDQVIKPSVVIGFDVVYPRVSLKTLKSKGVLFYSFFYQ